VTGQRDSGLADALASWLGPIVAADGSGARAEGLTRLSGGASRQTWAFDLVVEAPGRPEPRRIPLVVQRARPGGRRSRAGGAGRHRR
jgi:hypothetical protein